MARLPTDTENEQFTDADKPSQELEIIRQERNLVAGADAVILGSFEIMKDIGRMEMAGFYATISEKVFIEIYLKAKKTKAYKGLPYIKDEKPANVATLEEFCTVFLRKSYRRCEELAGNYNLVSADLYEQAQAIGFRQSDYNALKALPDDDRKIIAVAIEEENFQKAIDLMSAMANKHQIERKQAAEEIKKANDELESANRVMSDKNNKIDELSKSLYKKEQEIVNEVMMPGDAKLRALNDYVTTLTASINASMLSHCLQLLKEFADVGGAPRHIELAIAQSFGRIQTALNETAADLNIMPQVEIETAADDEITHVLDDVDAWHAEQARLNGEQS